MHMYLHLHIHRFAVEFRSDYRRSQFGISERWWFRDFFRRTRLACGVVRPPGGDRGSAADWVTGVSVCGFTIVDTWCSGNSENRYLYPSTRGSQPCQPPAHRPRFRL